MRDGAVRDLELQAELLDAMGLGPEAVVVLHVGGAAGGHEAGIDRFLAGFERLSERARERLVIENDDRTYASATYWRCTSAPACASSGTSCTTTATTRTGSRTARRSRPPWPPGPAGVTPKIHFSSPKTAMEERKKRVGGGSSARGCCPSCAPTRT